MKREEAASLLFMSIVLIAGALTWLFGPYGLLGVGVALLVAAFISDVRE